MRTTFSDAAAEHAREVALSDGGNVFDAVPIQINRTLAEAAVEQIKPYDPVQFWIEAYTKKTEAICAAVADLSNLSNELALYVIASETKAKILGKMRAIRTELQNSLAPQVKS